MQTSATNTESNVGDAVSGGKNTAFVTGNAAVGPAYGVQVHTGVTGPAADWTKYASPTATFAFEAGTLDTVTVAVNPALTDRAVA